MREAVREEGKKKKKSWPSPTVKVQRKFLRGGERENQSSYVPQGCDVSGDGIFEWEGRPSGLRALSLPAVGQLAPQFELLGE